VLKLSEQVTMPQNPILEVIEGIADLYGIWFSLASIVFLPIILSAIALSLPNSQRVVANIDVEQPRINGADRLKSMNVKRLFFSDGSIIINTAHKDLLCLDFHDILIISSL